MLLEPVFHGSFGHCVLALCVLLLALLELIFPDFSKHVGHILVWKSFQPFSVDMAILRCSKTCRPFKDGWRLSNLLTWCRCCPYQSEWHGIKLVPTNLFVAEMSEYCRVIVLSSKEIMIPCYFPNERLCRPCLTHKCPVLACWALLNICFSALELLWSFWQLMLRGLYPSEYLFTDKHAWLSCFEYLFASLSC